MRQKEICIVLLIICSLAFPKSGIFGTDKRVLLKDVCDDDVYRASEYQALGRSICIIVNKKYIQENWATEIGNVPYPKFGCDMQLYGPLGYLVFSSEGGPACSTVRFVNEYIADPGTYTSPGAVGTGFCIGDRSIMTASHIFYENGVEQSPADYIAIFNWMDNSSRRWNDKWAKYANRFDPYYYLRIIGYDTYNGTTLKKMGTVILQLLKPTE